MKPRRIIVVGSSAGGLQVLNSLIKHFPQDWPAATFIVQHVGRVSMLPELLQRAHPAVAVANHGETVTAGRIYVAPPNHHLLLADGKVQLSKGPRENLHRPSINVLFRSAARTYGPNVIGIVLTGSLDDGSAGLFTIKSKGGLAIVQDPKDAPVPDMPKNALRAVKADFCMPVSKIGPLVVKLVKSRPQTSKRKNGPPAAVMKTTSKSKSGSQPSIVCPECHGPLTQERNGELVEYGCMVGHRFTLDTLTDAHAEALERAMWIAVRSLEERVAIHQSLASRYKDQNQLDRMGVIMETAEQARRDAELLREIAEHL
jgi:two-component system, chemotaxis family, protein-glutamate methylesterase/glutaminase